MPRFILIPLLALGTVAGFAHGFHSLHHWQGCEAPQAAWQHLPALPPAPAPMAAPVIAPVPATTQTLIIPIIVGVPSAGAQATPTVITLPSTASPATAAVVVRPAPQAR